MSKEIIYPYIRMALAKNKMSVVDLAKETQISRSTIVNRLYGKVDFPLSDAILIKKVLKLDDLSLETIFSKDS